MDIYKIMTLPSFEEWLSKQTLKEQWQIDGRLDRIKKDGHFGDTNWLDRELNIWELKWRCGRRVYYTLPAARVILLLHGGNKNGQTQDINKARKIARYERV